MANSHMHHVHQAVPNFFYFRRAGAEPTPLAPWTRRRQALIEKLATYGDTGMPVNVKHAAKTHTREAGSCDLQRLIREGYAQMTGKSRTGLGNKQHKCVRLTALGKTLVPPVEIKA